MLHVTFGSSNFKLTRHLRHSLKTLDRLKRSLNRTDLIRKETEGHQLTFNLNPTEQTNRQRLKICKPFHSAYQQPCIETM